MVALELPPRGLVVFFVHVNLTRYEVRLLLVYIFFKYINDLRLLRSEIVACFTRYECTCVFINDRSKISCS